MVIRFSVTCVQAIHTADFFEKSSDVRRIGTAVEEMQPLKAESPLTSVFSGPGFCNTLHCTKRVSDCTKLFRLGQGIIRLRSTRAIEVEYGHAVFG